MCCGRGERGGVGWRVPGARFGVPSLATRTDVYVK